MTPPLPIEPLLPELRRALHAGRSAVLQAPPGSGKTTRVPLALLDAPWLEGGRRILLLQPRRLAARAAAERMAATLGEPVGRTVGYRTRLERRVSSATRIEVLTEGLLTRRLLADPGLEGVGAVLFDEFHERSLQADLGLALCLEVQGALREDLRLLVMSATLAGEAGARLLGGGVPVLTGGGRFHPVETRHLERDPDGPIEEAVAAAVLRAQAEADGGDVLAVLPGEAEIRRAERRLLTRGLGGEAVRVLPLYGALPRAAQVEA
ncbi:MAG TPA: DEAD/DEAH box helicase, partial [Geminicoccaceae bacterium]|nr:DEAD/DEAH box helicase [Geminicoccaceae bacterium]